MDIFGPNYRPIIFLGSVYSKMYCTYSFLTFQFNEIFKMAGSSAIRGVALGPFESLSYKSMRQN